MDLLGNKNQDMTLEEVLRFVEAKEAGKRSAANPCNRCSRRQLLPTPEEGRSERTATQRSQ